MSPEPFVSRAKAPPAKRSEKGYGDENGVGGGAEVLVDLLVCLCFYFNTSVSS